MGTVEIRLSVREMARRLGVSKSMVGKDAQAGMPMHDVEAARAWRASTHDMSRTREGRIDRDSVAESDAEEPDSAETGTGAASDEHTIEYRRARAARERITVERTQLELDQLRGRLVDLDEAKRMAFTAFRVLRDSVLNVPARLRDLVAIETDPLSVEQMMEDELVQSLASFDAARVVSDAPDDDAD